MVTLRAVVVGFFSVIIILQNLVFFLLLILLLYCLVTTKNVFHLYLIMLLISLFTASGAGNLTRTVGASAQLHGVIHNVSVKSIASVCSNFGVLFNFAIAATLGGIWPEHLTAFLARNYDYHGVSFPKLFVLFVLGLWLFAGIATLPLAVGQCSVFASHLVSLGIAAVSTALFYIITYFSLRQYAKDIVKAEERMDFETAAQRRLDILNTKAIRRTFTWISVVFMIGAAVQAVAELVKGYQAKTIANFASLFIDSFVSAAILYTLLKEQPSLRAKSNDLYERVLCVRNAQRGEAEDIAMNDVQEAPPLASSTQSQF